MKFLSLAVVAVLAFLSTFTAAPARAQLVNVCVTEVSTEEDSSGYLVVLNAKYMKLVELREKQEWGNGLTLRERALLLRTQRELASNPVFTALIVGAPDDISSCRVTPRPITLIESRTLAPADAPPSHISIDVCLAAFLDVGGENRTLFPWGEGLSMSFTGADARIMGAYGPGLAAPLFDVTLTHPTIGFTHQSFDGNVDFAGLSGSKHTNFRQTLLVIEADVVDPNFYMAPHQVDFLAVSPGGVQIQGQGAISSFVDQRVSIGMVEHFTPAQPAP